MSTMKQNKFIFVVGGVMSSVGKGISSASIASILQAHNYTVTNVKCDMYVNIDAGTIRPTEHGEVFIGKDGIEADQDLGNYERFTNNTMTSTNYITTGQVYQEVIRKERNLEYKGEDVEVVPDIPNEIIRRIKQAQKEKNADITIVEFGGTVGEYQVLLFLEAARMLKIQQPEDVAFVMVSYLPLPEHIGEMKTKPTQHAIKELNSAGIKADFIIARGKECIDEKRKNTLELMCNINRGNINAAPDARSIYQVPNTFCEQEFDKKLLQTLSLEPSKSKINIPFKKLAEKIENTKKTINIAIVGKYFATGNFVLSDSYISVIEATKHAGWANNVEISFHWVDPEKFETGEKDLSELKKYTGIICPGGFGTRGTEGVLSTIKYVRENNIPFLGICHGMQLACIEFARNVLEIKNATSSEFDPKNQDSIIHNNPMQVQNIKNKKFGGTMRLGEYEVEFKKGSKTKKAYGKNKASERHRHRYEFNNKYRWSLENEGLTVAGTNPETSLVEIVELENHPFFIGVQFHPEFESRPEKPHPLFFNLIKTVLK